MTYKKISELIVKECLSFLDSDLSDVLKDVCDSKGMIDKYLSVLSVDKTVVVELMRDMICMSLDLPSSGNITGILSYHLIEVGSEKLNKLSCVSDIRNSNQKQKQCVLQTCMHMLVITRDKVLGGKK